MLSQEQVLEAVRGGRESVLDGRDYRRLCAFFPADQYPIFGFELNAGTEPPLIASWTEEAILARLGDDLAFGFEKALDQRGISASLMVEVVRMWLWILEVDVEFRMADYAQYGLPIFKAVAVKYGFPNPIGDDNGDEPKYACD